MRRHLRTSPAQLVVCVTSALLLASCAPVASEYSTSRPTQDTRFLKRTPYNPYGAYVFIDRTPTTLTVRASEEGMVRRTFEKFGVSFNEPLVRPLLSPAPEIITSQPVIIGGQYIVYRMHFTGSRPKLLELDAVLYNETGEDFQVVKSATEGFGNKVWAPLNAVARKFSYHETKRSSLHTPGCGNSTLPSCL